MSLTGSISGDPSAAHLGAPYSFTFETTGAGSSSIAWGSAGRPSGLTYNSATHTISGTPTGSTGSIAGEPPVALLGVPYSFTFETTGVGSSSVLWGSAGAPPGLSYSGTTHTLFGTPN